MNDAVIPAGGTHAQAAVPGRRNLVVGLGQTGMSCVRYLAARGERVAVVDSRLRPPELPVLRQDLPQVTCHVGGFAPELLAGTDRIVISPGVDRREALIQSALRTGIEVIGDVELFARELRATQPRARVVGITGTNGKSTVTALVEAIAQRAGIAARAGANFGPPALDLLAAPRPDLYVLELSSFQLESTVSLPLAAAVVLNVTPDHMDRYGDLDEYAAAKARIFPMAAQAIVNADDPLLAGLLPAGMPARRFSVTSQADYCVADHGGEPHLMVRAPAAYLPVMAVSALKLGGRHNVANALAALAVADVLAIPRDAFTSVMEQFTGLAHRMQLVERKHDVAYVNDSKGTNVGATLAAVGGIDGIIVLIAGGDGKGQDFSPLAAAFRGKVRHAVLIGRDRELLGAALRDACTTEFADDMSAAVLAASRAARGGDIVLLSPACASLDMYKNYAARGEDFARAVRELH